MLHAHSQPSRCSVCSCTCARHFRRGLRPLPVLAFRLVGNIVSASSAGQSRRPQSAEVLSLSAQKVPIQNRMRTRILIVNHLFCVHCCAVYTVPGNGRLPVPVTWMGSVHRHDSGGIFLCTSQHRARTAPGSLGPSHADYCLRQRLSLYVAQYRPLPARCQDTFRPKHEKYRPKPAFSVSLSSIE